MPARVMLSSVTKDDIPLGDIRQLNDSWYQAVSLPERIRNIGKPPKPETRISFTDVRREVQHHLEGKYGFEVFNFQNSPTDGGSPETETLRETHRSHFVIGLFGTQSGWKVPDQDPLTPTFREWRAALESPLKFKIFALKGSFSASMPPLLNALIHDITDFKKGQIYQEFDDAVGLFLAVDRNVRDYVNKAIVSYAQDYAAKQPNVETEKWLLLPYRSRVQEMMTAFAQTAEWLGVKQSLLTLGSDAQPVQLHCVPDSFSIPESKKFAAYIFDDEITSGNTDETGKLHIVASFGSVTDLQIRRHLGNFEAAEVYSAPWGFYATVAASGMQCVYLPRCINSLSMQSKLSLAISWLAEHAQVITNIAKRRSQILQLNALPLSSPGGRRSGRSKK
jgi:hypothetical protein